jgi:hypothetical protein
MTRKFAGFTSVRDFRWIRQELDSGCRVKQVSDERQQFVANIQTFRVRWLVTARMSRFDFLTFQYGCNRTTLAYRFWLIDQGQFFLERHMPIPVRKA